jgi:hypothetical protein
MEDSSLWQLLITAIVFTFVGRWQIRSNIRAEMEVVAQENSSLIIERTIDSLVDGGFIRTKTNESGEVELLKYDEE